MFDEMIYKMFINKQENIENNIQKEYHERIKKISIENKEERNNIKMGIISELYYKEGFKDGIKFILDNLENKKYN